MHQAERSLNAWGRRGADFPWSQLDSSPTVKLVGAGTVFSAAILGAWLGYHASAPSVGAVTGTLAAVAAANLGLIVLEVVRIGERPVTVPSIEIAALEHPMPRHPV